MISANEAQSLMKKFIQLRDNMQKTNSSKDIKLFKAHEKICISKFKYLIDMRTSKYKNYSNYDDLCQEGMIALLNAMKNYNPKKGIFFYWAHRYIETKIVRMANNHSVIRFPIKAARINPPKRESTIPVIIDFMSPDKIFESSELKEQIKNSINHLEAHDKKIVNMLYGFDGEKQTSITNICKDLKIKRDDCLKSLGNSFDILKTKIVF